MSVDDALMRIVSRLDRLDRLADRLGSVETPLAKVRIGDPIGPLAGPQSGLTFENVPQSYRSLEVEVSSRNDTGAASILLRLSSDGTTFDSDVHYDWQYLQGQAAAVAAGEFFGQTSILAGAHSAAATVMSSARILLVDYTNTSHEQPVLVHYDRKDGVATTQLYVGTVGGWWRTAAAIKGVQLLAGTNNFAIGSVATLYGLP